MFKLLRIVKYKYLEWKWDRVLKKSGCADWESYFIVNDPDFNYRGYTVKEQFCGYPYIVNVPYTSLKENFNPFWGPFYSSEHIQEWCKENCKKKYRLHWERVIVDHNGQYLPNGIGGTDEMFLGFQDETDAAYFKLVWG
jgi:hypothetical protein